MSDTDHNKGDVVFGSYWELLSNGIQPYLLKHVWIEVINNEDPRIKFEICLN